VHYLAALLLFGTASVSLPGAVVSEKTEANGRGNTEYQPFSRTKCCFIATNRGFYIVTQKYKHFTLRARKKLLSKIRQCQDSAGYILFFLKK